MLKTWIILLLLYLATTSYSQTGEKRIALVIGNAAYQHGGALKNPVNDANLMELTLKKLGFTVLKTTNATKAQMLQAIDNFKLQLSKYDVALFYYAGHGMEIMGKNLLIPVDASNTDENAVRIGSVDVAGIVDEFENYSGNVNLVILDACRDNPFLSVSRGGNRGFKVIPAPSGTLIAFSTAPGAVASDGTGNNGLYTSQLVSEMLKPQRIEDVFINTRNAVLNKNPNQNPQEWSQLRGKFYFMQDVGGLTDDQVVFNPGNVEKATGSISIDSEPGGTLYLNGKSMGSIQAGTRGARLDKIAVGNHTIELKGSENFTATVSVTKDRTSLLTIKSNKAKDLPGQLYDRRDGKYYRTIKIGKQLWMAENLAFNYGSGCWAYDNNLSNVTKYGYLYNWETAKNVCPEGWHLPSDDEWKQLEKHLGMSSSDADKTDWRGTVGNNLKSTGGWYNSGNGTNSSGFNALPGGYRDSGGSFYTLGEFAHFWSSSAGGSERACYRALKYGIVGVSRNNWSRSDGYSVRCLQD